MPLALPPWDHAAPRTRADLGVDEHVRLDRFVVLDEQGLPGLLVADLDEPDPFPGLIARVRRGRTML